MNRLTAPAGTRTGLCARWTWELHSPAGSAVFAVLVVWEDDALTLDKDECTFWRLVPAGMEHVHRAVAEWRHDRVEGIDLLLVEDTWAAVGVWVQGRRFPGGSWYGWYSWSLLVRHCGSKRCW